MKLSLSLVSQLIIYTFASLFATTQITQAQINPDGTVNTQVNQNNNVSEITGGETRGSNLFHSFKDFSVDTGNEAFFNNANSISNIFSRVTGGKLSNINGLIRANGNASLFLINPAGIIFGEGASLDIGGSFYGSTADSILFPDNLEFSATDLQSKPILTINAPIGLNFRDNPGNIVNSARDGLTVRSQKNLALVGGNVSFDGGFITLDIADISQPGATIELGGLTEPGTVGIRENGSLDFPDNVARGNVSLANDSFVNVTSGGGGSVFINAKNFEMSSNSLIFNSVFSDSASAKVRSGDIVINATEDVILDGANSSQVSIGNNVFASSPGEAGNIEISARNISLVNGSFLTSQVANTTQGRSSDITLNAQENITLEGVFSGISNQIIRGAEGNGGEINIAARNLEIKDGATISSNVTGIGNGSNINIEVSDQVSIDPGLEFFTQSVSDISSTVGASGEGKSGNINLKTKDLSLSNGGNIANGTFGEGISGNVIITADTISIDGDLSEITSATFTDLIDFSNDEVTQSTGGNLTITTNSLSITNGGELSTSSQSIGDAGNILITARDSVSVDGTTEGFFGNEIPSIIKSDVELSLLSDVAGNSGNIEIISPKLSVTDGGIISASTFSEGNAGNLTIRAAERVEVSNDGLIQADVFDDAIGTGGNLTIETAKLIVSEGAQISATTRGDGNAGNLTILATDFVRLSGVNDTGRSGLFATALVADGNGGELKIITQDLNISDGAIISVGNFPSLEGLLEPGIGEPGNLNIQANNINLNNEASINAATQSPTGEGANITLQVADQITLRNNSQISAQAFQDANGGNLNIDTNFIVAFPQGNNDIVANANQGRGGKINITAESLFGIQKRDLNPLTNDINASSEVIGLDGTITINTPDLNPVQGATELPKNVVEPQQTTAQACNADRVSAAKNGLTIKGKGGIPPAPELPLNPEQITINGENTINLSSQPQYQAIATSYGEIIPSRGVMVTENGEVFLTAYVTNHNQRILSGSINCSNY